MLKKKDPEVDYAKDSPSNLDTRLENLNLERFGLVLKRVSPLLVITQSQLTAIFHAWHGDKRTTNQMIQEHALDHWEGSLLK